MFCYDRLESGDEVILPGFRFHPTDEELVGFYLRRKIQRKPLAIDLITQLDIYKFDPWELPKMAMGDKEWYFFCQRDRKYRNSTRPNRVTGAGFWKATGTDRQIYTADGSECIGLKKTLVFYRGRAAKGLKTDWMMHEFRLPTTESASYGDVLSYNQSQDSWAICRIFKKNVVASHRLGSAQTSWMPALSEKEVATISGDKVREERSSNLSAEEVISVEERASTDEKSDTTSANTKEQQSLPHLQVKTEPDSCITTDSISTKHNRQPEKNCADHPLSARPNLVDEDDQLQEMAQFLEMGQRGALTDLLSCEIMSPASNDPSISNCFSNSWDSRNQQTQVWDDNETMHNGWAIRSSLFTPRSSIQKDIYELLRTVPWDTPPLDQFSAVPP